MRFVYQKNFLDQAGNVVSNGQATVFNANSTVLATIYSSSGSTGTVAGSVINTGTDGFFNFWIDTADYSVGNKFKITLSKTNFTAKTYDDIEIISTTTVHPEWFGAKGDGVTDDTTAVNNAINSLPASGGIVFFDPSKKYAMNITLTKSYVTLKGAWSIGASAGVNKGLVPYLAASPVITIGDDSGTLKGTTFDSIYIQSAGPGGAGTIGLRLAGGATEGNYNNLTISGSFSQYNLRLLDGTNNPVTNNFFNNVRLQTDANVNVTATLNVADQVGGSYTSANYFNNMFITGPSGTGTGRALILDNLDLYLSNTWLQVENNKGVLFQKSGAYSPHIIGHNVSIDSSNSNDVLVETYNSSKQASNILIGQITIDGLLKLADASTVDVKEHHPFLLYGGTIWRPYIQEIAYFARPGDPYNQNAQIWQEDNAGAPDFNIKSVDADIVISTPLGKTRINNVSVYADNAAAIAAGLIAGELYKTATGQLMIVY